MFRFGDGNGETSFRNIIIHSDVPFGCLLIILVPHATDLFWDRWNFKIEIVHLKPPCTWEATKQLPLLLNGPVVPNKYLTENQRKLEVIMLPRMFRFVIWPVAHAFLLCRSHLKYRQRICERCYE